MIPHSDTQTICVHSSPFVVHRKKKIIVLIIIVFVGIVAIGIWFFGHGKSKDPTKTSNRGYSNGGKHEVGDGLCDTDGSGINLWRKVSNELKKDPLSLTMKQRKILMERALDFSHL